MRVAAGIVTYNPNIERLTKTIQSIYPQVNVVVLFDNHSGNIEDIKKSVQGYKQLKLIEGERNFGIATGLNSIAEYAYTRNYQWLLTLDHDSVPQADMISEFLKFTSLKDVALLCPRVVDYRQAYRYAFQSPDSSDYNPVQECITAGSFLNLEIWKKIGGFDEFLFIDFVDYEYCYKLRANHYAIYKINGLVLDQELGDLKMSKHAKYFLKMGEKLHSQLIMSFACKKSYSVQRRYYCTRNYIYCHKKYPQYIRRCEVVSSLVKISIKLFFLANNRWELMGAIFRGIRDGKRLNIVPYNPIHMQNNLQIKRD